MKKTTKSFLIISFIFSLGAARGDEYPKLLWEKSFTFEIQEIKLARESGDVLLGTIYDTNQYAKDTIELYNKSGSLIQRWKCDETRTIQGGEIADDGSVIVYREGGHIDYGGLRFQYQVYCNSDGTELWRKKIVGFPFLSPDGKFILVGTAGESDQCATVFDSAGTLIWKKKVTHTVGFAFSPDSKYALIVGEDKFVRLYEMQHSNLLWKKKLSISWPRSLSEYL